MLRFKWMVRLGQSVIVAAVLAWGRADLRAEDWPQWRGPDRDGVSSETGLLKDWPAGGPRQVWVAREIGSGYSTPAVAGDRLYLLGTGEDQTEFVAALQTSDGHLLWKVRLGKIGNPDQKPNYPGVRSTPTVEQDLLYVLGSDGDLICLESASGKERWRKNLRSDFGGKPGEWAYSESPLLDGDKLICTPGGSDATVVTLDKQKGNVIWKCAVPGGDDAAYSSAIVVQAAGLRQYVQFIGNGLIGIEAKTGKFLWRYPRTVSKYRANIPTPVAEGDLVYSGAAGTGGGVVKLIPADGGVKAEEVYFESKLPTAIGGVVRKGKVMFGTTGQALLCADFATGKMLWEERSLGAASILLADDRLYLHGENGEVALVEASDAGYHEKGRFNPPDQPKRKNGMEKAWAYPVVANGKLYIRDHDRLWCFDVRK